MNRSRQHEPCSRPFFTFSDLAFQGWYRGLHCGSLPGSAVIASQSNTWGRYPRPGATDHPSLSIFLPSAGQRKERKPWRAQGPRPPLPVDPSAPTRCQPREVLRRRVLRHQIPPRGDPRASRSLCRALGRLGRERPQCPALPAQRLPVEQGRCSVRRRSVVRGKTQKY
jgi:hypothetical protein